MLTHRTAPHRPLLHALLALLAGGLIAACGDRALDRSGLPIGLAPGEEPEEFRPAPPVCGDGAAGVGQATYDVSSDRDARGICAGSSDECTVCPQPGSDGRLVVYQYRHLTCTCPYEAPQPLPQPAPPPPPPAAPSPICGEAGSAAGQATYDVSSTRDARGICVQSGSDSCTVCYQPDGSGRLVVYQYVDITCVCAPGTELPAETPPDEPGPQPTPSPVTECGLVDDFGHATYDLADEASAHEVCNSSDEVCTICDQADNSGRFAVYQYDSTRCACPPQPEPPQP